MDIEVYDINNNILHIYSGTSKKAEIGEILTFEYNNIEDCDFIVIKETYIDRFKQKVVVKQVINN